MENESFFDVSKLKFSGSESCCVCQSSSKILSKSQSRADINSLSNKLKDMRRIEAENGKMKEELVNITAAEKTKKDLTSRANALKKEIEEITRRNVIAPVSYVDPTLKLRLQHASSLKADLEERIALQESLSDDLKARLKEVSNILFTERMKNALKAFRLMPVMVTLPAARKSTAPSGTGRSHPVTPERLPLTGCSSILSIPLPNSGDFNDVPFESAAVALSHVAHLCDSVAAALNIPLPHPLMPFTSTECLVSPQYDLASCFSLSPVIHLNDRSAHDPFGWTTANSLLLRTGGLAGASPVGGSSRESSGKSGRASPLDGGKYLVNHAFPQALKLLQADVVSLCMHAGIPPEYLWPPEAMLLNLHELFALCLKCVKKNAPVDAGGDGARPALPPVFASEPSCLGSLTSRYSLPQATAAVAGGGGGAEAETVVQLTSSEVQSVAEEEGRRSLRLSTGVEDAEAAANERRRYDSLMGGDEDYDIIERSVYHS